MNPLIKALKKVFGEDSVAVAPFVEEPRDDNPPFECAICHTAIPNRNDVVCVQANGGKYSQVSFGVPANDDWDKLVCSSKCAHAMLDQHIVTWRLRGLFNIPEELDEY